METSHDFKNLFAVASSCGTFIPFCFLLMTRKNASAPPTEAEMLDLTVAIESLTETVHVLQEEVRLLRETIRDDLEVSLSTREPPGPPKPVMHITSMSKDPCAKDFAVNRYSARDLPNTDAEQKPSSAAQEQNEQGTLW